jgi:hypothetical protein
MTAMDAAMIATSPAVDTIIQVATWNAARVAVDS